MAHIRQSRPDAGLVKVVGTFFVVASSFGGGELAPRRMHGMRIFRVPSKVGIERGRETFFPRNGEVCVCVGGGGIDLYR